MIKKSSRIIALLIAFGFISSFIYGQVEKAASDKQEAEKIQAVAKEVSPTPQKESSIISSPSVSVISAQDFNSSADKLVLYIGQTQYIPMTQPKSVRIGNPLIADIVDVANNQVGISAKAIGQTNFIWEDRFGGSSLMVKVLGEDLTPIKARIERVLSDLGFDKQIMLGINEDEGKVFMTGNLKTEDDKQKLNLAIERMKDKIIDLVTIKEEKPLVEIEVEIYDMNEGFDKQIGVQWPQSMAFTQGANPVANDVWQRLFDFNTLTRSQLTVTFNFGISENMGRVLAHPRVLTLSGKEAVINSGGQYPVFEQKGDSLSVNYKPYGVVLKIKPTVMDDNRIQTSIEAEVSAIDTTAGATATASIGGTTVQTYTVSGFSNRKIQTELYMKENDTLVMGGLIYRSESKTSTRLPGLGKLPFFNQLFRNTRNQLNPARELIIIVTPHIVRQKEDMKKEQTAQITTPTIIPQERYRRVPADLKDYIYELKKRILDNASYPSQAKDMGAEGIVKLKIHILKTGQLDSVVLETSSNNTILDNAALTLVKDLAPYKPFPKEAEFEDIWVDLPLVYHK